MDEPASARPKIVRYRCDNCGTIVHAVGQCWLCGISVREYMELIEPDLSEQTDKEIVGDIETQY